ncbi:hypothetical protein SADUNF_Sadunf10G0058200 [Salix dunnii]|uniref:Uncharacterized protein n=1 Tax=Salix dunnii TaxID=1413687 RepID=A0A835JPX8_9ROSI|nr:hypothetical protein SADUNF_Sadunf10G0058200 [Salix dunnii]
MEVYPFENAKYLSSLLATNQTRADSLHAEDTMTPNKLQPSTSHVPVLALQNKIHHHLRSSFSPVDLRGKTDTKNRISWATTQEEIERSRQRESAPILVLLGRWRENEEEMGAIKRVIVDRILTCMWVFGVPLLGVFSSIICGC